MALESLHLEHLPGTHTVHVALFDAVTNAAELQQQLLHGNPDFEYAFIDASVVVSRTHALAAAFRAVHDSLEGRLKTRNVHSEIVFGLSPNNNIADAFRRFGISPSTTALLVIKVSSPAAPALTPARIAAHLRDVVAGVQVPFADDVLAAMTDRAKVRRYYKLNDAAALKMAPNEVEGRRQLESLVVGAMALRGAT